MNGAGAVLVDPNKAPPLEGDWLIVSDGGREYVGRLAKEIDGWLYLSPAYEWDSATIMPQQPNGGRVPTGRDRWAFPIEFARDINVVRIRPRRTIEVTGTLRDIVAECVHRAEAMRRQLQAKDQVATATARPFGGGARS